MSQHRFEVEYNGDTAFVLAGWDRPLNTFFMSVTLVPADKELDEKMLYSDMEDPNVSIFTDWSYFEEKLAELKIKAPEGLALAVQTDCVNQVGNSITVW